MSKPLILIVEDDEATAECLTDLLQSEGYATEILPVPGTLEAVRSMRPSLILLDLVFPESKGEDLLRALRRDRELERVPVVLLSAVPRLADVAARLPVQGHVGKPFDLEHLLQTIGSLVQQPPSETSGLRLQPGLARER
jgi:two-component system alkaline phosphatase synthesis response regulator PhoP